MVSGLSSHRMGNHILEIEGQENQRNFIKYYLCRISPCTKNCSLNSSTNLCEGCGRNLDEIVEWTRMSDEEKQEVMSRLNGNQSMSSN